MTTVAAPRDLSGAAPLLKSHWKASRPLRLRFGHDSASRRSARAARHGAARAKEQRSTAATLTSARPRSLVRIAWNSAAAEPALSRRIVPAPASTRRAKHRYQHAPVMRSRPAASRGRAALDATAPLRRLVPVVADVLGDLEEPRHSYSGTAAAEPRCALRNVSCKASSRPRVSRGDSGRNRRCATSAARRAERCVTRRRLGQAVLTPLTLEQFCGSCKRGCRGHLRLRRRAGGRIS